MSRIIVDLGWVQDLHCDVTSTAEALEASPRDAISVPSSYVQTSFNRFMRGWDKRAGELGGCLVSVGEFLDAVFTGFSTADEEIACSVEDAGNAPAPSCGNGPI